MTQERIEKKKAPPKKEEPQEQHADVPAEQPDLSDIDELLDEIDGLLEEQDVLVNYRQKGGQ